MNERKIVLVIEPDDETAELLTTWLHRDGFGVVVAETPMMAFEMLKTKRVKQFQVILYAPSPLFATEAIVSMLQAAAPTAYLYRMVGFEDQVPDGVTSIPFQGVITNPLEREDVRRCLADVLGALPD